MAEQHEPTEAEKEAFVPGVRFVDGPAGRRPRVASPGGLDVWEIIDCYHQEGDRPAAIREVFPHLTEAQIEAALTYYRLFPAEIDAWIEHNYTEMERARLRAIAALEATTHTRRPPSRQGARERTVR